LKLIQLHHGRHCKVMAVKETKAGQEVCPVVDFLNNQPKETAASAKGFRALFIRYSESGTNNLTTALFHEANKEEKIWEFIKGRLRVYCFIDSNNQAIILASCALKKGQKAPTRMIEEAVRIRERYLQDLENNKTEIEATHD